MAAFLYPMRRPILLLAAAVAAVGLAACATPIAPPGGPADTTPPRLVSSEPASGAVNVDAREVTLTFSERLDPTAARRAVSVTPEPAERPEIEVRGDRLTVRFEKPLRDSTTYVLTLGTALADNHRVAIGAPIVIAFSTGPQVDGGRIAGRVREPGAGAPVSGMSVFAYAAPDSTLPDPRLATPEYRTETDASGAFELRYLRDVPFYVVAVEDRDRDRRADDGERFAVPSTPRMRPAPAGGEAAGGVPRDTSKAPRPRPLAAPESAAGISPDQTWAFWTTAVDTTAPGPRSVRPLARRRVAVRFDEPVRLLQPDSAAAVWAVADSANGAPVRVAGAFRPVGAPQQVVLLLAEDPEPDRPHTVRLLRSAVADSAGNAAAPFARTFAPSSAADTAALRVEAFLPDGGGALSAGIRPGIRMTLPPPAGVLAATDTLGTPLGNPLVTDDGITFRLREAPGESVRIVAALPDTTLERVLRVAVAGERGGLTGTVRVDSSRVVPEGVRVGIEAWPEGGAEPVRAAVDGAGAFSFGALPAGTYRLRAWLDLDGDGAWSGGQMAPYRPAEPLLIAPEERVRARWEAELDAFVLE